MTSQQFEKINTYLSTENILNTHLQTIQTIQTIQRYNLIKFFYKIKLNWDNYQLGKSICPVTTNWKIVDELNNQYNSDTLLQKNGLKMIEKDNKYQFRPVLAALFYKYIQSGKPKGLYKNIIDAFNIEKQYKINARNYFKGQCQCPDKEQINKDNYKKYYFVQPRKYIGNK